MYEIELCPFCNKVGCIIWCGRWWHLAHNFMGVRGQKRYMFDAHLSDIVENKYVRK